MPVWGIILCIVAYLIVGFMSLGVYIYVEGYDKQVSDGYFAMVVFWPVLWLISLFSFIGALFHAAIEWYGEKVNKLKEGEEDGDIDGLRTEKENNI